MAMVVGTPAEADIIRSTLHDRAFKVGPELVTMTVDPVLNGELPGNGRGGRGRRC